jgi:chemosensory pili system protein ChpA (sensor histidine kinase/response regulator)
MDDSGGFDEETVAGDPLSPKRVGASDPEQALESEGATEETEQLSESEISSLLDAADFVDISVDDGAQAEDGAGPVDAVAAAGLPDLESDLSADDQDDTLDGLAMDESLESLAGSLDGVVDQTPEPETSLEDLAEDSVLDDSAGDATLPSWDDDSPLSGFDDSSTLDDLEADSSLDSLAGETLTLEEDDDSLSLDYLDASDAEDNDNPLGGSESDDVAEDSLDLDVAYVDQQAFGADEDAEGVQPGALDLEEDDDLIDVTLTEAADGGGAVEELTEDVFPPLPDDAETAPEQEMAEPLSGSEAAAHPEPPVPPQGQPDDAAFQVIDIDTELLEIFLETLDDSIETVDAAAAGLSSDLAKSLQKLKNTLHTLKGGANSIGLRNYGALVHDFETALEGLEYRKVLTEKEGQSELYTHLDQLHEASQHVKLHQTDWGVMRPSVARAGTDDGGEADEAEELPVADRVDSIRVGTNRIDRLLDMGLEVSMSNVRARRALDLAHQDRISVQSLARRVEEIVDKLSLQLDTEIQAKTEAAPDGEEFDPLEMDRLTEKQGLAAILREAAFDLHEEAKELGEHVSTAMSEAISSSRLIEGTQSDLRLLRLVAFSRLGPGFRRLVNQVSRQLGKQVEFDLTCDEGGLDVSVFEQVKTALEHMLRNSVDHGIEMPEERKARGKSETGKVSLIIYRQAAEFVIRLMDDGKGLAPETLRKKAVERGILREDERISEADALQLIFNSGLSTAEKVTDISGRGVGMDVVQQSIAQIGGTVTVSSKPGFYTQFDIRVPASIMVNGALLAAIGEEEVAVPLTSLDGSDFRHRDEILKVLGEPDGRLSFRNEQYELRYLGAVRSAGSTLSPDTMADFMPVLFARHGRRRVAFFADSVTNAEELVIRSLGAQFTGVPGIAGGSLKPDGQPVLALDLNELIRQVDYADSQTEGSVETQDNRIVVLCVDDSVMMRRTYEKRLSSLNYDVVTAEDGEAALDYLAEATRPPDFVFTDLEMPNMNGFDFIANMRRLPVMADVPTVVVSSRDGDKHRAEANRVGATDFMAKGSNSAEGMQAMIQRYLSAPVMASQGAR